MQNENMSNNKELSIDSISIDTATFEEIHYKMELEHLAHSNNDQTLQHENTSSNEESSYEGISINNETLLDGVPLIHPFPPIIPLSHDHDYSDDNADNGQNAKIPTVENIVNANMPVDISIFVDDPIPFDADNISASDSDTEHLIHNLFNRSFLDMQE